MEVDGANPVIEKSSAKLQLFNTNAGLYIGENLRNINIIQPRQNSPTASSPHRWYASTAILYTGALSERNYRLHIRGNNCGRSATKSGSIDIGNGAQRKAGNCVKVLHGRIPLLTLYDHTTE